MVLIAVVAIFTIYIGSYFIFRQSKYFVENWGVAGDSGINRDIILIDGTKEIGRYGYYIFIPIEKIEGLCRDRLIINCGDLSDPREINEWLKNNRDN